MDDRHGTDDLTIAITETQFQTFVPGQQLDPSNWVTVDQSMVDQFGAATLDPDPMHIDPEWAREHGPYSGTIAFGFFTMSLLTPLLHSSLGSSSSRAPQGGHYLNYGFNRLRLVSPVPVGSRVRGRFSVQDARRDSKGRLLVTFDCTIDIEGEERPALIAEWLSIWVPEDDPTPRDGNRC